MKPLKGVFGLSLLLLAGSVLAVEDMKCYVELADGSRVVLQGPVANGGDTKAVQEKFKQKGYEIDGAIQPVLNLLECQRLGDQFQSLEARKQDERQPR
ncbi:TapY2 family type IVa secretion system protein [Aeromonas caviae]|uniref:TapY2 family type IVa secretion system protein n=1 Tax=Aeromonas caviae TaxID=648 RepID=UPI0038CFCE57